MSASSVTRSVAVQVFRGAEDVNPVPEPVRGKVITFPLSDTALLLSGSYDDVHTAS